MTLSRRDIVAILGFGALASAGVGVYAIRRALAARQQIDPTTFCPLNGPVVGHTALVIDRTDPFTREQARQLRQLFQKLRGELAVHELLSTFLITAEVPTVARPVLSRCNPGDPSSVNEWIDSLRRVQERWRESFGKPIDDLLEELLRAARAERSPIIATLRAVAARFDFASPAPRRLIIFSDMLENMGAITHYGKRPDPDHLAAQIKVSGTLPELTGVTVEIVYLGNSRDARFQGPAHLEWWRRFLNAAGARSVNVIAL
jgi:hypothetical protein